MRKKAVWYSRMSPEELDKLAAPFENREIDFSELKPLTPDMRRRDAIARRKKPGRPVVGKGAKRLMITMERSLLNEVDRHTRKHDITRAAFIAGAVRAQLRKSA